MDAEVGAEAAIGAGAGPVMSLPAVLVILSAQAAMESAHSAMAHRVIFFIVASLNRLRGADWHFVPLPMAWIDVHQLKLATYTQ
jgi:hypothetical protein